MLHSVSQMTLAAQADLTHTFITDIEGGKKWVSAKTISRLAEALQVEPYQFFLPDIAADEGSSTIFTAYMDDFTDNLQKMVGELKHHYLPDMDKGK
ncbi:hypothetical protein AGMMS49928_19650 [Spirochaetia bacterium]|nr:hypothetical protein AGMMS49928_19650 [Spirochaetia bacterium]